MVSGLFCGMFAFGALWVVIGDISEGTISLPTGRHSHVDLPINEPSPAVALALVIWGALILFFAGGALISLRESFRAQPRFPD